MAKPISQVDRSRGPLFSPVRAFTLRQISMQKQNFTGSISQVLRLVLRLPANGFHGLRTAKSRFAYAHFEKSRKKQKTTISNAISISRNARPNAASKGVNCRMS